MVKDGKGLQIIDGFRQSPTGLCHTPSAQGPHLRQSGEKSLYLHPSGLTGGELTEALKTTERRLSSLLEDRTRIGRDLHDCILQSLYVIGLNLETSLRVSPHRTPDAKQSSDQVVEQINQLIHEIRRMICGLAAGTVQEFDLTSELTTMRATYEQAGRLQITLDLQPKAIEVLTNEEEREILNIVREALSNCARHADATHATVSLRLRGARVRVAISDDGTGFEANKKPGAGYGLANMAARAKRLGGHLKIRSQVGQGTHIIAEFSLELILSPV